MRDVCVEIVQAHVVQDGDDGEGLPRCSDNDSVCAQRWGVGEGKERRRKGCGRQDM